MPTIARVALVVLTGLSCSSRAQTIDHVVVVLLDDVGVDKVAAYGAHPTAGPTPVLDRLAAEGVMFTRAYADPVCAASRAAALTGLYGSRTGVGTAQLGPGSGPADPTLFAPSDELPWMPRVLSEDGVRCAAVGKWHLTHKGVPNYEKHAVKVGFGYYAGSLWNLGAGGSSGYHDWEKTTATGTAWRTVDSTTYATADSTAEALAFLLDAAASRSFVWLALNATHKPWHQPPAGTYTGPPPLFPPAQQQAMLESAEHHLEALMAAYAAAEPEAAARTLWLVMGDNGTQSEAVEPPWDPEHAKGTCLDGGTLVPLIAWGAGVRSPGSTCDAPVHIVDLWATVIDALRVRPPSGRTDSVSLLPALARPASFEGRGWAYTRHAVPPGFGPYDVRNHAATDGRWKLIEHTNGSRELYDLLADPLETTDLWPPSTDEQTRATQRLSVVLAQSDQP
jgi:arylsulfatase A-like enzyme